MYKFTLIFHTLTKILNKVMSKCKKTTKFMQVCSLIGLHMVDVAPHTKVLARCTKLNNLKS